MQSTPEEKPMKWLCRYAPSLGDLERTHEEAWDTLDYDHNLPEKDQPCVFFGLYGLPDFYALWRYPYRKAILWAGSDITNFINGYWLEDGGSIKLSSKPLATWINKHCESYVENEVEHEALARLGIDSRVVPSFMGNVKDFDICYEYSERPKLYTSVSGDNFDLYGWDKIPELARENPDIEFHCYGNEGLPTYFLEKRPDRVGVSTLDNIIIHGRVSKERMNREIESMQGALRLTKFDGFSEILAKSLLMGQWPVSLIQYPFTIHPKHIQYLHEAREPNVEGRDTLLATINQFPWNQRKN